RLQRLRSMSPCCLVGDGKELGMEDKNITIGRVINLTGMIGVSAGIVFFAFGIVLLLFRRGLGFNCGKLFLCFLCVWGLGGPRICNATGRGEWFSDPTSITRLSVHRRQESKYGENSTPRSLGDSLEASRKAGRSTWNRF